MAEQKYTSEVFLKLNTFDENVEQKPTKKKRRRRNSCAIILVFFLIILILAILAITFVALYARERNNCNGATEVRSSKAIMKECLTNNLPTEPIHQSDANCTTDIDECSMGKSNCRENAKCINTFGSYVCSCKSGFYENGNECIAVKECSTNESTTAPSRPSVAIAETNCTTGIDKCLTEKSSCDPNAECINTLGSFICSCKTGFYGNGKKCTDVEECLIGKSPCHKYATCMNTVGSYLCSCQTGFSGTGTSCTDIDECLTTSHSCHGDARCSNTVGSYNCSCKTGFTGDGVSCVDSKECLNIFTEPSYNCVCKIGSTGKEITNCTDPKYAMQFSGKQNGSSVVRVENIPSLDKFSVCLWIQTNQSSNVGFLSYFADSTSRFNLYVQYGTMGLNIGPVPYSLAKISDGKWHHVCYSWSSVEGHVVVYIDRKLDLEDFVILKNRTLIGGGDFVIGQYRGYDGKVDGSYTTSGKITQLHFWNRVLTANEIIAMSNTCLPPYRGNLVSWNEFRHNTLC